MSKTGIRTIEQEIGKQMAVRHFLSREQTCEACWGEQVMEWTVLPGTVTDSDKGGTTEPGCTGWN